MIRKLTVMLLSGVICLLAAISAMAYSEAPMLRVKVAAGEIPALEERLPEEPLVITPIEEVGQYGGTLHSCALGPGYANEMDMLRSPTLFRLSLDLQTILPDLFKGYEFSDDGKIYTVYLRKGVKWSDGAPFTADDILFWYEDIMKNEELNPGGYVWTAPTLTEVEKIDDYTVRYHSSKPTPTIIVAQTIFISPQGFFFQPKHFLKNFHIKYNPQADELAKEAGYDNWWQLFQAKFTYVGGIDPDLPSLGPWILKETTPTHFIFERNPYYWVVDTAGNQLPYIDTIVTELVSNVEVEKLKLISGEVDFRASTMGMNLEDYPLYIENAEKGNYRILLWNSNEGAQAVYGFNLNNKDPVLREIFQEVRFRQAMSLAINRQEINQMIFFGKGVPRQYTTVPSTSYYEEEWAESYAQYSPEEANRLLDEIGLAKRDSAGYRLRPDGEVLQLTINHVQGTCGGHHMQELVRDYWQEVGVKTNLKTVERTYWFTRLVAGEFDVLVWGGGALTEFLSQALPGFCPGAYSLDNELNWAPEWSKWYWGIPQGEQGEEPPQVVKRYFGAVKEWMSTVAGTGKYTSLAKEMWELQAENLWLIGTVGLLELPTLAKKNLRNIPEKCSFGIDSSFWNFLSPEQWFFSG